MRKCLQLLLLIALAVGLMPNVAIAAKTPPAPAPTFSGSVASDAGVALAGAKVEVFTYSSKTKAWGPTPKYSAVTDASGRFSLQIPAATYRLRFSHPAFVAEYYDEKATLATGTNFVVGSAGAMLNESLTPLFQDGSQGAPYLVYDVASLNAVRTYSNAYVRQVADVDLSATRGNGGWQPLGTSPYPLYRVTYDGGGHRVTGMYADAWSNAGLFGSVSGCTVRNLNVVDAEVVANQTSGILVGGSDWSYYAPDEPTRLENCTVSGIVRDGDLFNNGGALGGLVGFLHGSVVSCNASVTLGPVYGDAGGLAGSINGEVFDSFSTGRIFNVYRACGGLLGNTSGTTVARCWSSVDISDNDNYAGGLVGSIAATSTFTDCYALGDVISYDKYVGGLFGRCMTGGAIVERCFAAGRVYAPNGYAGGIIGYPGLYPAMSGVYYDAQTTAAADNGQGIPKTTAEMQDAATYVGWDFMNVWNAPLVGVSYPTLR